MPAKKTSGGKAWRYEGPGGSRKLAVTIAEAAELLGISEAQARALTLEVEPYLAAGGVRKWPLKELARALAGTGRTVSRF
jgi:hypothetical protein